MEDHSYLDIKQIIKLLEEQDGSTYRLLKGKRKLYQAALPDGRTKCICILESKYHVQIDGYWIDITVKQKDILDAADSAYVLFLLQGMKFSIIDWAKVSGHLTKKSMMNNTREGDHWKLYIRNGYLEVRDGDEFPLEILQF